MASPGSEAVRVAVLPRWRALLPDAAALLLLALGLWSMLAALGGRQDYSALLGLATALPLYLVGRGWRLPLRLHLIAAALPLSVPLVSLLHLEVFGVSRMTGLAAGAILLLGAAAWARGPRRRLVLVLLVVLLALVELGTGWFAWVLAGDPSAPMQGSLGWHNQFGILCTAAALLAALLAVLGRGVPAALATAVAGLLAAGVLFSGSRASLVLLALGALLALLPALLLHGAHGLLRWAALPVAGLAAVLLLWLPWLRSTAQQASPLTVLESRYTFESSGVTRLEFWSNALRIGAEHPLAGGGWLSYRSLARCFGPQVDTVHAHNEWLHVWAEGGAAGLLPLLLLTGAAVWLVLRRLRGLVADARARGWAAALREDPARWAALPVLAVLFAHLLVDFDWLYPVLVAVAAILAGVLLAAEPTRPSGRRSRLLAGALIAGVFALGYAASLLDPILASTLQDPAVWEARFDGCPA